MDMIAPVSSAAATRPLQLFSADVLTGGQVIQARVTRVDGNVVQLRVGDQTVSVSSKVPLMVGQQVNLLVEEGSSGKMVLRMVDDTFAGRLKQARPDGPTAGRGSSTATTGTTTPAGGRQLPINGVQGRAERDPNGSPGGQSPEGGEPDWGGTGGGGVRSGIVGAQARSGSLGLPELGQRANGTAPQGFTVPGQVPGAPGQVPGAPGQSPARPGQWPGQAQTVGGQGQIPANPGQVPGAQGQAPGAPGQTPGAPGQTPGAPGQMPGAPGQAFGAANPNLNGLWLAGANAAASFGLAEPAAPRPNGVGRIGSMPGQPAPTGSPRGGAPTTGPAVARTAGSWTQTTSGWMPATTAWTPTTGTWTQGLPLLNPTSPEGDPLASVFFEKLDESAARLAGSGRMRLSDLVTGTTRPRFGSAARPGTFATPPGHEHVARAALPAYGRLAQSVGGAVAFGQLMAALPHEVVETFARAPLSPTDLGRLLIDVGVHPDEMNAVLVGEMLTQRVPVQEASVRALRRELAAAGGTPADAAPTVALSRLGLPITPLSLAVARQMLAGQLDPPSAWGELLPELQRLARFAGSGSQAGVLAAELLADWRVPVSDGPEAVAQWLRATLDQAGTPLEAKLARPFLGGAEPSAAATPGQDVRARLDLLAQALPTMSGPDREPIGQSLQRLQATVQAEQLLNGSTADRAEPRYFAVTLPAVLQEQPSTLQIRVRERDAKPRAPGELGRPDLVQLKLSLPGLGDLGVNLTIGQHSVACHFAAGTSFAEALLTASAGELVGRLKRLGYAHTAVDATHEPPEVIESPLAAAPRVSHVDVQA